MKASRNSVESNVIVTQLGSPGRDVILIEMTSLFGCVHDELQLNITLYFESYGAECQPGKARPKFSYCIPSFRE